MIISQHKPFEEIEELLRGCEKLVLVGCGQCATACMSGGEKELMEMKEELEGIDKKILTYIVPETSCNYLLVRRDLKKIKNALEEADAVCLLPAVTAPRPLQNMKISRSIPVTIPCLWGKWKGSGCTARHAGPAEIVFWG